MKSLIAFFVDRSFTVNLISAAICIAGLFFAFGMQRDLLPSMQFKEIVVRTTLPGASPTEIERNVTFPIEEAVKSTPGIEKIRSWSEQGWSYIKIEFEGGYKDMDYALESIKSRVEGLRGRTLPKDIERIRITESRLDEVDFLYLALTGSDEFNLDHREWSRAIQEKIRRLNGITDVTTSVRDFKMLVKFREADLRRFGLSISQARRKIIEAVQFAPVAQLRIGDQQIGIEMDRGIQSPDDLKTIPISGMALGKTVYLNDIADVELDIPKKEHIWLFNGKKEFTFRIVKSTDSDIIDLRNEVVQIMDDFNARMPTPLKLVSAADTTKFIEKQLNVLRNNGALGFVLVAILLTVFLGRRNAFVTLIGLPIAYLGTVIALQYFGVAIDLISVIGMIIVIGVLVDDAIIVSEKYASNLESGLSPREAAINSAHTLLAPVTGTILTTMVAFSPILLVDGPLKTILFSVPVVVIAALVLSWIECFFILPNHLKHFAPNMKPKSESQFFHRFKRGFERLLTQVIRWRYVVLGILIIFTGITIWLGSTQVKSNFDFRIGATRLTIYATLKSSPSLEYTLNQLEPLHEYLGKIPKEKVETMFSRVGKVWIDGEEKNGYKFARIRLYMPDLSLGEGDEKIKLEKQIKEKLEDFKTDEFQELYLKTDMQGNEDAKKDMISFAVRGDQRLEIKKMDKLLKDTALEIEGINSFSIREDLNQPVWKFKPNKEALIQYGIHEAELGSQLAERLDRRELISAAYQRDRIWIYTQVGDEESRPKNQSEIEKIEIVTPQGTFVPISVLGSWSKTESPKEIVHRDGKREVEVLAKFDPEKFELKDLVKKAKEKMKPLAEQYPSYQFVVENADEMAAKNENWALKAAALCVFFILVILALVLNSLTQPILVGMAIPFGVLGIIWALYLHQYTFGVMVIIGLLGVAGVAVNDSLILVDQVNRLRKESSDLRATIIAGASSRLRAIVLTTITTLGGVFPMAYGIGGESGFTQPLAFSMGWGLTFSTIMTLFILPVMIAVRDDVFALSNRAKTWIQSKIRKHQDVELNADHSAAPGLKTQSQDTSDTSSDQRTHG